MLHNERERRRLPNGDVRWFDWTNRAIYDEHGNFLEFQAVGRDLTEQYLAESSLRRSEARHRAIVEDQNEMICRFDEELRLTFANPAYYRFFSRDDQKLIGTMFLDLIPDPEAHAALVSGLRSLSPENPVFSGTYREISAGGDEFWHHWANRALFDEKGQVVEYQAVGRDVTREHEALEAVERSEQRFRGVAETHPVPVLIFERQSGDLLYVSPAAVPTLGPDLSAIEALKLDDLFATARERERFEGRYSVEGRLDQAEFLIKTTDGRTISAEVTVRSVDYDRYQATALGLVDISDRKQAEEEIARQRESLAQSEKMSALGSLLASVAHELNNPLSIIVGQGELLEMIADDPRVKERAGKIKLAADRCARIVGTFLSMARKKAPTRAPTGIPELVHGALELAGNALRTTNITVETDLPDDLPEILADGDQLMQVILNLIINAQHALSDFSASRQLRISAEREGGESLRLVIEDSGPGVPEQLREQVFEPFFTTKPEGLGTGIGLSVCQSIMSLHGGEISMDDSDLGGARFALRLPIRGEAGSNVTAGKFDAEAWSKIGKQKILVVDDEAEVAQMILDHLASDGHEVSIARNGQEALEKLRAKSFDIVLSDLRMPELDGPGLYEAIDEEGLHPLDHVAFLTGDTLSASARRFLARAQGPYLEKPFKPDEVRQLILGLIGAV